jgi:hypothetical protein
MMKKWETVPIVFQDYESEEQEYLDVQADNAIARQAELDLSGIHSDLKDMGPFDIELLGLKNFLVEPADKPEGNQKKEKECPNCGHVWKDAK